MDDTPFFVSCDIFFLQMGSVIIRMGSVVFWSEYVVWVEWGGKSGKMVNRTPTVAGFFQHVLIDESVQRSG